MKTDRISICVSGAAEITHCGISCIPIAKEIGREIVRQGGQIVTGATTGFPYYSAVGAKEVGGVSVGLSPAASKKEHVETYGLPVDCMDVLVYTGFGYAGRDLMLVRSSDAVIIGCGRIGTIHEFTIAWESDMPIGILEGEWKTDEVIRNIIDNSNRTNPLVIFRDNPKDLVSDLVSMVRERDSKITQPLQLNIERVMNEGGVEEVRG